MLSMAAVSSSVPVEPPPPSFVDADATTIRLCIQGPPWPAGKPPVLKYDVQFGKKFSLGWDSLPHSIPSRLVPRAGGVDPAQRPAGSVDSDVRSVGVRSSAASTAATATTTTTTTTAAAAAGTDDGSGSGSGAGGGGVGVGVGVGVGAGASVGVGVGDAAAGDGVGVGGDGAGLLDGGLVRDGDDSSESDGLSAASSSVPRDSSGELWVDVPNLAPDSKYSFRVRAANRHGWSAWSSRSEEFATCSSRVSTTLLPIVQRGPSAADGDATPRGESVFLCEPARLLSAAALLSPPCGLALTFPLCLMSPCLSHVCW
jgi:hypothetical protein